MMYATPCCVPWETLVDTTNYRVQRRGWQLRLQRRGLTLAGMDAMTKRLRGWYGETLAAVVPDYTRSMLIVGMDCAALPAWAAEWLPSCTKIVAVDVLPLIKHLAARYFFAGARADLQYFDGDLVGYVKTRMGRDGFDVVLLDGLFMVGARDIHGMLRGASEVVARSGTIVCHGPADAAAAIQGALRVRFRYVTLHRRHAEVVLVGAVKKQGPAPPN